MRHTESGERRERARRRERGRSRERDGDRRGREGEGEKDTVRKGENKDMQSERRKKLDAKISRPTLTLEQKQRLAEREE